MVHMQGQLNVNNKVRRVTRAAASAMRGIASLLLLLALMLMEPPAGARTSLLQHVVK